MSDNSWYENGELPPVGCKCMRGSRAVLILAHMRNGENKYAAYQQIDGFGCGYASNGAFTPIKTERELAIDAAIEEAKKTNFHREHLKKIAGVWFDAGLLRTKNES